LESKKKDVTIKDCETIPILTDAEHPKQLENELLRLRIENAYSKELRRLCLEEDALLKK